MFDTNSEIGCGSAAHFNRRTLLKAAGLGGAAWLTPLAELLAREDEVAPRSKPAKSVIVLWMAGGPSQLETFDPHPGTTIGGDTKAIKTAASGAKIGHGLEQLADVMDSVALVRSVTSKEGDHERATYNIKTGFRPDPTLIHPSIGAVVCHQLSDKVEIPRHVSILQGPWPARGGYLGDQYDAFKIGDPRNPIPDVTARVPVPRDNQRQTDLDFIEQRFARGRFKNLDDRKTLHNLSIQAARKMMSSDQLKAFDISKAPQSERDAYGDSSFGRGCLAALRLIEVGVRCVEVTLNGWDSHANNHSVQMERVATLDPAFASLIRGLKERGLFESTIVICGGEFGRTPRINPAGGRDHWPHGFSIALAGGGIRGGHVVGETSPDPKLDDKNRLQDITNDQEFRHVHATVLHALGIEYGVELPTPVGRPMIISEGEPITELLT